MNDLIKTKIPGFVKDKKSGVLLNTDTTKFENIKQSRVVNRQQKALEGRVQYLEDRLNKIEQFFKEYGFDLD